jgi:hypothetical protein
MSHVTRHTSHGTRHTSNVHLDVITRRAYLAPKQIDNCIVFSKASFYAQNEAEEQKNQEFTYGTNISRYFSTPWICCVVCLQVLYAASTIDPCTLSSAAHLLSYVFCIGAGGRVFVMGTCLGLLASLVTTFFPSMCTWEQVQKYHRNLPTFLWSWRVS